MTSTPSGSRRFNANGGSSSSSSGGGIVSIGNYRLSTTLGVGSFGKVKLAEHIITGHQVAVKILSKQKVKTLKMVTCNVLWSTHQPTLSQKDKKIRREIQIMKLFRHPHIIKLYEVIETEQDILLIMEYVSGGELFEYIVAHGKMPEDKARRFFQQIIAAVEYCHAHMIVHRDLKPENLLLDDVNGSVKIADFGLSNVMEYGAFLKTSCGSPNYAAPEVISGSLYAGCVPTLDHQLLTSRGFMFAHDLLAAIDVERDPRTHAPLVDARHSTVRVRDWRGLRVASYDSATGHLLYEQPRALILHPQRSSAPPLVQFSRAADAADNVSVVATPNHNMFARLATQHQFSKLSAAELARSAAPFQFLTLAANGVASSPDAAAAAGQKRRCCVHELPFARALGARSAAQVDAFLELYGRWLVVGDDGAALLAPYAATRLALLGARDWSEVAARVGERCAGDEWLWTQLDAELARRVVDGACAAGGGDDSVVVVASVSARDTVLRLALHAGLSGSFARCGDGRWRVSLSRDATVALSAAAGDAVRELSAAEMAPYQSGATWCCTMPSGFVVVRRAVADAKGVVWRASRATIQGNSEVDVWSCGVILYALLNARLPFDNDHIPTLFKRIRSGEYAPPLCSPSCADLIQRCLCVDALKRITIPEIREHPWFRVDLPAYLAEPPRDVTELASLPIDDDVVAELQSMLGNDTVSYGEIQQALQQSVAADGTVNPLAVAYNLVYDQRMAADRTAPALSPTSSTGGAASSLSNPLLLATSPPMNLRLARPFVDVVPPASLLSPPQSSMMPMTQQAGDVSTGTSPTDEAIFSAKHMWFLGKMSRQAPIEIMREVYRVLQQCNFKWKVVSVYSLQVKCLHDVKISLQLYKISNQKHLLDFKKMSGPQLEFFDACNVILNSLHL